MPRYVAFLRAVNVGGRTIKMERLRQVFTDAGFTDVETFIASGNVIFTSRSADTAALERRIERTLEKAFGYPVGAYVRLVTDLAGIAAHQPFETGDDGKPAGNLYISFLRTVPPPGTREKLLTFRSDLDDFDLEGREVYWLVRGSLLDSKAPAALQREFGTDSTMRNRNTVARLAAKYGR